MLAPGNGEPAHHDVTPANGGRVGTCLLAPLTEITPAGRSHPCWVEPGGNSSPWGVDVFFWIAVSTFRVISSANASACEVPGVPVSTPPLLSRDVESPIGGVLSWDVGDFFLIVASTFCVISSTNASDDLPGLSPDLSLSQWGESPFAGSSSAIV